MTSSNQSLPAGPSLLIDSSGAQPFVGIWQEGQWLSHQLSTQPALDGVFSATRQCLLESKLTLEDIRAFIHNEGPGSILGIRVSAMAIRTWRAMPSWENAPAFAFRSLVYLAAQLRLNHEPPFTLITDYRKDAWLALLPDCPDIQPLDNEAVDLISGPLFYLPQRKAWRPAPAHAVRVTPDLASHPELFAAPGMLTQVEQPIAYAPHQQDYKTWNAERHRGSAD